MKSLENDVNCGWFLLFMNLIMIGNFCEVIKLLVLIDICLLFIGLGRVLMNFFGWDMGIRIFMFFLFLYFKYLICWICVDLCDRMDFDLIWVVFMNILFIRKMFFDVYVICW